MAVQFAKRGVMKWIRFTSDVSHDGEEYGPQYDQDELELDARTAAIYVHSGRAIYIEAPTLAETTGLDTATEGKGKELVSKTPGKSPAK